MQKKASVPTLSVEEIRGQLLEMFRQDPRVRISVQMPHSRQIQAIGTVITGVFPHVFSVEERDGGVVKRHSFRYADVLTRRVEIGQIE